jgi:capsular exopolysaccharide synthesis family protein
MLKKEEIFHLIENQHKQETQSLLFRYLKKWKWFVAFALVGVVLGFLIYRNSPNTYEVTSRIIVKSDEKSLESLLTFNDQRMDLGEKTNIVNQIGLLRSYTLYREAVNKLNWNYSWYEKKFLYNADLYRNDPFVLSVPSYEENTKSIPVQIEMLNDSEFSITIKGETSKNGYKQKIDYDGTHKFGQPFKNEFFNFTIKKNKADKEKIYLLYFNDFDNLTSYYLEKTAINSEDEKSDFIAISLEGETKHREADFINELNNVFIEFGMKAKYENSDNSVKFIDSQLERLKGSLGTAEENFSNYRRNNQVMDLGQEAQAVYTKLEEIEQEQYLTQLQLDYYVNLRNYLDDAKKIEEMVSPSVIGITDANLTGMLEKLMELYSRREVLSFSVREKSPTLVLLEKEIKVARDGLDQTLKNQQDATELKLGSLNERYKVIQQRLKGLPETEKKLIGVQRDYDLNNEFYNYMLQKKAEVSISKASIAPEVQVIDKAIVEAAKRKGPNLIMNLGIGLIGGGIIPFVIITLMIFFNNKIETIQEIEIGSDIPVFEGIMKHKYKVKLPFIHHPRSGIAESFRGLKTSINTVVDKIDSKVISVNSLVPNEGKSFVSSNLSCALAKSNKKVLLIGADLHKPTLHVFLEVKESFGLSNYLNNEKSMEDIISSTSIPDLYLIQTGSIPENPSDLMDSVKFEKLIVKARQMFDYVVIDNAPLLLIPDAILTSQLSDISLFILRLNYSHKEQVKQINKIVEFNKIECSAIVPNDTPESGYAYGVGYRKKYWKNGYGEFKS